MPPSRFFLLVCSLSLLLPACAGWIGGVAPASPVVQEIDFYASPPLWLDVTGGPFKAGNRIVLNIFYIAPQNLPHARLIVELPPELAFQKATPAWQGKLKAGERKLFRVPLEILSTQLSDVVRVTMASGETSITVTWP